VLRLVSMASTIESGKADSLSKTAIFCSCRLHATEVILLQAAIGAPCSSVTVTNTVHQFDVNFESVSDSWATETSTELAEDLQLPVVSSGKLGQFPGILLARWAGSLRASPCFSGLNTSRRQKPRRMQPNRLVT